ncbi:uncharacterized protein LOC114940603 [Nylanderia fulva]|uniref:uncharacterized protein LOC114940603 n=1 Tax=Nylanderia fulva TaxID=613905 RepID=UPI0010FB1466|nr:uncharacterized protein LOC114940603 [Nylanderia fulva]
MGRRMLKKERQEENDSRYSTSKDTNNESIDNQKSAELLFDTMDSKESLPEGRRIVDFSHVWKELQRLFNNHIKGIECQFKDWKLIKTKTEKFKTHFTFKCQMCNTEAEFWSEPKDPKILSIDMAAAIRTITVGIGYAQLKELCAAMNIQCMSDKSYMQNRDMLVDEFEKTAMENMKMAGQTEKQLALKRNDVINGIPYITVIADGSWSKRSYGHAYDSLSGVGTLIGYHTKKVLFIGIRNKYCTICDVAERNRIEPKKHKCYKNFDRNASSTSMESDAIAEGFKSSLEMHGLIFRTVIADGDSSVYQAIIDSRPYREQMVTVKKIECTNHLLRNLCKKLQAVAGTTQPKMHRKRGFVQLRNVVKNNIMNIRTEVIEAIDLRNKQEQPHHDKARELQKDILNIPSHIFGEHKRCKERGRICDLDETKKNYVPFLKLHDLYQRVEKAIIYLSAYSDGLLYKYTNPSYIIEAQQEVAKKRKQTSLPQCNVEDKNIAKKRNQIFHQWKQLL